MRLVQPFESIIKDYGFNFETIKKNGGVVHMVSYKESVALMKDGQADVFMAATSVPQASFIELENSPGIRFIGLPKERMTGLLKIIQVTFTVKYLQVHINLLIRTFLH